MSIYNEDHELEVVRHHMCCVKAKYASADAAEAYVRKVHERKLRDGSEKVHSYSCVFCGKYHVGGDFKNKRKRALRLERLLVFGFDEPCPMCESDAARSMPEVRKRHAFAETKTTTC